MENNGQTAVSQTFAQMPKFESTIPFGEPELMRVSGFQHYLDELAGMAPEGRPSTRLSSLSPSLTQDLLRFEQHGRSADLLEVLAAAIRHSRSLTVHLQCGDKVVPLTLLPREHVAHCPLDLVSLLETDAAPLTVLQVEPAVLRAPGDREASLVGAPHLYGPMSKLLWAMAMHGARTELLPEVAGAAVYRVSPAFDLAVLRSDGPLRAVVQQLRREVASQRDIAGWPGMNRELAARLLNALYLQAGLIISRSHPAALASSWFGSV